MTYFKYFLAPFLVLVLVLAHNDQGNAQAQSTYAFDQENSSIHMYGSSNYADWDTSVGINDAEITVGELNELSAEIIQDLSFNMPVTEIDGDDERLNENIYYYLEQEEHPYITFELIEVLEIGERENNSFDITAVGEIEAAGVADQIELTAQANLQADDSIRIQGEHELLMTDFDIEPPTAMMGAIVAEDWVRVEFDVTLIPDQ